MAAELGRFSTARAADLGRLSAARAGDLRSRAEHLRHRAGSAPAPGLRSRAGDLRSRAERIIERVRKIV